MARDSRRRGFRQLRRAIIDANHSILALENRRADALAILGTHIANGLRVADEDVASYCGSVSGPAGTLMPVGFSANGGHQIVRDTKGRKTAVVSFRGLVTYAVDFQPYAVSTKAFTRTMRELAADVDVKSIVVVFDSPGGTVIGVPDAADAMFAARRSKQVLAIIDPLAASAAYWIASQASEISLVPSGYGVGSIGCFMLHMDCSRALDTAGLKSTFIYSGKHKVEGNSFEPLSDETRRHYQKESDEVYEAFVRVVARGRGVAAARVKETYGQGRVVAPRAAKQAGMVDRLELVDDALERVSLRRARPSTARSLDSVFQQALGRAAASPSEVELLRAELDEGDRENRLALARLRDIDRQ